jgi:hypothetical protein
MNIILFVSSQRKQLHNIMIIRINNSYFITIISNSINFTKKIFE